MTTTSPLWISKLGFESLLPSQDRDRPNGAGLFGAERRNGYETMKRPATLVSWALAPAWVTVDAAAALLGCDVAHVLELVDAGAVDAEEDAGAWLVEKASLREYQEIREVLADGD